MQRVAAFFDVDHTVLEINSGARWVGYQWRTRQISPLQTLLALKWLVQYRFGMLDFEIVTRRILADYKGRAVEPIYAEVERFFHDEVAWAICSSAEERIEDHRDRGHEVVLLTSATRFLCRPLARKLRIDDVICTEVEVRDGILTGRTLDPVCYGVGKVQRAESFAREREVDLAQSFFYTDSVSDLPMLDRVGNPRIVNPDPRLRRLAGRRGWAIERWTAARPQGGRGSVDPVAEEDIADVER